MSFKARAQVQGIKKVLDPEEVRLDDVVEPEVLEAAKKVLEERFGELIKHCADNDCDVLGIRELLHKYNYKYYEAYKDKILSEMKINYKVEIQSIN